MAEPASEVRRRKGTIFDAGGFPAKILWCGEYVKSRFPLACFGIVAVFASTFAWGQSQTFGINGQSSPSGNQNKNSSAQSSQTSGFGWGSSIEVARQARAANDALKRGDYNSAVNFAEQAAKAAPQDSELWFLYGYAARLANRFPASIDAYNRGLKLRPGSIHGLAGLAETYARMGRPNEAEKILQKVLDQNPKDVGSLQLIGELLLSTDPKTALGFLQRADAISPTAHTDLLIAHAYERLGQRDRSDVYLNRAKSLAPTDPDVLRAVAEQFTDAGHYDQAISTLQSIPNRSVDANAELAYTYGLAGKQQEAADLYSQIAQAAKSNISLDLSAAQAWVNAGQPDKAAPFLGEAHRIDQNSYRLHAIQAEVDEGEQRIPEAISEYQTAINNLPAGPVEGPLYPIELRLNLYELAVQQNNNALAKEQLAAASSEIQQAQVPDADRPELLRLRAAVEMASGNTDAANKDLQQALTLAPGNINSLLNYAALQWKLGQKDAARETFSKVLQLDNENRTALSSLGYLARDNGDTKVAESYFMRAEKAHPRNYESYLALGDLYAAARNFHAAQGQYEDAYRRMPTNPLIVAGGANAALEAHNLDLAKRWLDRATGTVADSPQVMREQERYLNWKGKYAESADLGYRVLAKLPHDREGVDYLAYDLYYLGRYDEVSKLVDKYRPEFGKDKDLDLIAGNLAMRHGQQEQAVADFTSALKIDPNIAIGYSSRGYAYNDLKEPGRAVQDFRNAIKLQPNSGEAHLGLAFAELQLHNPKPAIHQLDIAQKYLGKNHLWHLAKAEAYRQEQDYSHAEAEYRIALEEDPNDLPTLLIYSDVLFQARHYAQALAALDTAQRLAPTDPRAYALRAQIYAKQMDRPKAMENIQLAEKYGENDLDTLMSTGDALLTLGDRDAAMQRFQHALDLPHGDRLGVRLAVAQVFLRQGHYDEARRQIAIGFAEARTDRSEVRPDDLLAAANIFLAMHDFDLAETYFDKAKLAGSNPRNVGIGLTNTYLAEGQTRKAAAALDRIGPAADYSDDYDYLMASANLHRQEQNSVQALAGFAQANSLAGQQDQGVAETQQYQVGSEEGRQINDKLSLSPEGFFTPELEDIDVYVLDSKILRVTNPALLPPPRSNFMSLVDTHYRLHFGNLPVVSGFVGQSETSGRLLYPSVGVVEPRNTYDTLFNGAISPVLHFGANSVTFTGGLQYDIRRDTLSPQFMSQNLFRQFLYINTSSLFNWVTINAYGIREAGPFTDANLHSRQLTGDIEFTVGRPWGNTALLTGYSASDLLFRPFIEEYFDTTAYVGLQHKFSNRITAAILAEDLRSWRVQTVDYATAQAFLPGARFEFRATPRLSFQGSFLLSRGMGFHQYDNAQSEFLISYVRPVSGTLKDGSGEVPVSYPFRISVGMQQQTFYDFNGSTRTTLLPIVHFNLF